uniref:Uncharacterized protein n=1 Tax=Rhizophora mucronata TaxID=61149 RepID=A0A2P2MZH2_RHIMU
MHVNFQSGISPYCNT